MQTTESGLLVRKITEIRLSRPDVFCKNVFLKISQNSQENSCAWNFIKKETLTQVFSCEFCAF